ncbi:MAG: carboxypeptidase-like regulatory domain-containing protein, partial [Acidobacteriota bacterium]
MSSFARSLLLAGLVATLALAWAPSAFAQGATTSTITGAVTDPDGSPLPGVTVTLIHEPTGTRYTTYTRGDGRFSVFNVRVGGPYAVSAELQGFAPLTRENLNVGLGETLEVTFALQLQAVQETVTVTATSDPIINPGRTGAESLVSQEEIGVLPTLDRSIADFARLDPYFKPSSSNDGPTSISVAGRNNRYNNIQIDGSVNNDLFGLAAEGTPGGQTETNAISLDAV